MFQLSSSIKRSMTPTNSHDPEASPMYELEQAVGRMAAYDQAGVLVVCCHYCILSKVVVKGDLGIGNVLCMK